MKKVTKKHLSEAKQICEQFGYWSQEVSDYINQFDDYNQRLKIHNYIR